MPRKYVKKRLDATYTVDDIRNCVLDIENKNLTFRGAAEKYGVPISVIFHRMKGRRIPLEEKGAGRKPVLSLNEEKDIVNCTIARARMGYPVDKTELLDLVSDYITTNNISCPFKDNKPGQDWYRAFMHRHPQLSLKKPELLQKCRNDARKPAIIYDFYEKLKILVVDSDLNVPGRECFIFNTDESGFNNDPTRIRGIGEKGKALSRISGGSGRENTTVLACISADGTHLPPFIIFKGAAVQARWTSDAAYPGTVYAASTNGWMEEPQFFNWFANIFVKHVERVREKTALPGQYALLLFDGHNSHISVRIVKTAIENKIHLLRFPSHLTDRLQPLDKCVFGPMKTKWEKRLIEYGKSQMGKGIGRLSKQKFTELLSDIWKEGMVPTNIKSGFVTTGICPVNPKLFPEEYFNPIDLEKYKKNVASQALSSNLTSLPTSSNITQNESADVPITLGIEEIEQDLLTNSNSDTTTKTIKSPTKIIEIFSNKLFQCNSKPGETVMIPEKKVIPRLRQKQYGEVLTTEEVLLKLQEAEKNKLAKKFSDFKVAKARERNSRKKRKRTEELEENEAEDKTTESFNSSKQQSVRRKRYEEELCVDSDSDEDLTLAQIVERENETEVEYNLPVWSDLKTGKFILVDFIGGSRNTTHYFYVCLIQNIDEDDGDITVMGLKTFNSNRKEFTLCESDVSTISFEMIKAVLPDPKIVICGRKKIYTFPGTVEVFEKM